VITVQSSDLFAVEHDNWSGTLTIEFHSGGVYEYYNVPRSEYAGLMNASSHGKYFHAHIKDRYSCRKIAG
jgi:KTSC domain-containing protein